MTDTSLLSAVLTLRPLAALTDVPPLGRAAHALLLNAVHWADAALADEIHAGSDTRPFTTSNLIGLSRPIGLKPDRTYTLRFTAVSAAVTRALLAALQADSSPISIGAEIRLADAVFRIEAVQPASQLTSLPTDHLHPWAAATGYEELSAPWLLGRVAPPRHVTLQFASPTAFKSGGRHVPVPLPALLFGSLLEKWNAFAPVAFPPELRRYAEECLALSAYQLRTHSLPVKEGGLRVGAVGTARYVATNYDRYWLSLINVLADFALFAGAGAGTTMGLGQCRKIAEERESGHNTKPFG
jgi:CRISPR-associated endoribonuclease Cas6